MDKNYTKEFINGRYVLVPKNGYVVTNGVDIYSRHLILEVGLDDTNFYTIREEEYNRILEEQNPSEVNYAPY
jgi:hypothetical protein